MPKKKKAEIDLEYQNYIPATPVPPESLMDTATSRDRTTVETNKDMWIRNIKANHKKYGPFKENSVGRLWGTQAYKPIIIAGSGPSLMRNGHELKDREDICLVSCLHNFHFFEDRDVDVDYYVTLDAQDVTIEEVSEGGAHDPDWYWERTKDKVLVAYIGSSPRLLERWQGTILFYNAPIPVQAVDDEVSAIEKFNLYFACGGNVLGSCLYLAKAILKGNPIAFVGADFSFSYDKKFHGWDSKYDAKMGNCQYTYDVFGNKTWTWPSYHGFKCYFDWHTQKVPGIYVNCTEGGTLGSYAEGNIMSIRQMDLCDFIGMYTMANAIKENCENPETDQKLLLY